MRNFLLAIMACTLFAMCAEYAIENNDGAVSSSWDGKKQVVEMNSIEEQDATEKNIVWSRIYYWAMGSDYVYIDSDGKIYYEGEMESPLWSPSGPSDENYTGKQFAKEELTEFLSIDKVDEDRQKEILRKKGIKLGKY